MAVTSAGGGAGAIEKRCPICLEDFDDKTFIDACFHCFCFRCIVQWSQVTTTCPMCKTSFTTLIHRVQANDNYVQCKVEPKTRTSDQEISIGEARRFRYRTTRVPGQPRYSAPEPPDQQETAGERERRERERQKRRIASQLQSNPASDERRRAVYSLGLLAQPPQTEGKKERVREISAAFFRKNPACTHRLVPWLTREIRVLLGPDHVQFVIQLVLSLIDKVELEGEEFHKHIQPFLLTRTSHFLHELVSFARSPFNMAAYDHRVWYEWPLSRVRDDWDPEATVNVTTEQLQHSPRPGPSGNSLSDQIQERLFDELTATRWDDSPPFLPFSSPILIHGSDSEDEDNVHTLHNTVSTSNTSTSTAMHTPPTSTSETNSATFGDYARTDDATPDATGDTTAGGVGGDEERGQEIGGSCEEGGGDGESGDGGEEDERESKKGNFREGTIKQNNEGEQNYPPSPGDTTKKLDHDGSHSAVRATAPNAQLEQVQPTLNDKSMTSSTTSCSSSLKCKSEVRDEDEMCIVINAESDSEYMPLETAITGSAASPGLGSSKLKGKESAMKTTSRHTCKGKAPSRERESLKNKKHKKSRKERGEGKKKQSHKKHRRRWSRSDDGKWQCDKWHKRSKRNLDRCYSSSSESSSDLGWRRFSSESRREKKHRRTHRQPRFREVELYYARERCHHSRLYSDDYLYSKTESEHRIRQCIRETVAEEEGVPASSLKTARVSVDDKKSRRKSQCRAECKARYSVNRDSEKLRKELSGLDQEIVEQKREALRAMLRCERLKLLHRELQGKDLPEGELCSLGQPLAINETTPTGEVQQQLAELDKAIMDGKRRVLHIMKKMEEQAPQSDDSSS